jgi:putative endonuclease
MALHTEIGLLGEDIAAQHLAANGYKIVARRWRWRRFDVDIVALHAQTVVFVEVKTRSSIRLSTPEVAVDRRKQQYLATAAQAYLDAHYDSPPEARFDVVAVVLDRSGIPIVEHFPNAFYLVANL